MLPVRSRRWFAGAAALAAIRPMLATAQINDIPRNDEEDSENVYTSPEFGMEVTWEAPWYLEDASEWAEMGYEAVTFESEGFPSDYFSAYTSLIRADFSSAEEYLDHFEASYDPAFIVEVRNHDDGIHYLIHRRTETTLTVMFFFNSSSGPVCELYEHHAEPDAEYALWSVLIISSGEVFETLFEGVQQNITINGSAPFTTTDDGDVIDLVNDALKGVYPDVDDFLPGN